MTRRSMPFSFHANLFALVPARCPSSTCGVAMVVIGAALGDVPFLPAVGDTPCASVASSARENVDRFLAEFRVEVSGWGGLRKVRPGLLLQNGMQFPRRASNGKRIPFRSSKPGCAFRATESMRLRWAALALLAQNQCRKLCLGVHHVVGAGCFELCAAAEAPADARTLKAGVVAGQDIDIGIAHIERGRRIGA